MQARGQLGAPILHKRNHDGSNNNNNYYYSYSHYYYYNYKKPSRLQLNEEF